MYFTLAIDAAAPEVCAALTEAALAADVAVMPVPGSPGVAWRSPDGCSALLRWPSGDPVTASRAGTISISPNGRVLARTSITRTDPVYVASADGATVVSDRAFWAAAATGGLGSADPVFVAAMLNVSYPLGDATPFPGVRALGPATTLTLSSGRPVSSASAVSTVTPAGPQPPAGPLPPADPAISADPRRLADPATSSDPLRPAAYLRPGDHSGPAAVAAALVAAVAPLRSAAGPVELSLTGGKDSRLVAAALSAAGVPFRARTHGFPDHPDVVVAAEVARHLGIEHTVATPVAPGQQADPLARLRASVLVAEGMLSAFENSGRPDPSPPGSTVTAGGHGGELLRGGYAEVVGGYSGRARATRQAVASAELLRRLTARRLRLLRPSAAARYTASLAQWAASLRRGPLNALDDFYLVNRAGRWSAAARQAYLIRENLVQPLFGDDVVRAARAVPLASRVSGRLSRDVLAELSPELVDLPLAGKSSAGNTFDWRRDYGAEIGEFFREYILEASPLFDVASRPAVERLLAPDSPRLDTGTVWVLATMACLVTGDWRNARQPSPRTYTITPAQA
jgi:hypothetical protein